MTQSDREAARAMFLAALNAVGIRFEPAIAERLAVEFEDHARDGQVLVKAMASDSEPLSSVRTGW
jgi:hypothetical protein